MDPDDLSNLEKLVLTAMKSHSLGGTREVTAAVVAWIVDYILWLPDYMRPQGARNLTVSYSDSAVQETITGLIRKQLVARRTKTDDRYNYVLSTDAERLEWLEPILLNLPVKSKGRLSHANAQVLARQAWHAMLELYDRHKDHPALHEIGLWLGTPPEGVAWTLQDLQHALRGFHPKVVAVSAGKRFTIDPEVARQFRPPAQPLPGATIEIPEPVMDVVLTERTASDEAVVPDEVPATEQPDPEPPASEPAPEHVAPVPTMRLRILSHEEQIVVGAIANMEREANPRTTVHGILQEWGRWRGTADVPKLDELKKIIRALLESGHIVKGAPGQNMYYHLVHSERRRLGVHLEPLYKQRGPMRAYNNRKVAAAEMANLVLDSLVRIYRTHPGGYADVDLIREELDEAWHLWHDLVIIAQVLSDRLLLKVIDAQPAEFGGLCYRLNWQGVKLWGERPALAPFARPSPPTNGHS